MEKKQTRPAAEKAAIQNLRRFLKEYLESSPRHKLNDFALKLGKTSSELGRYLRGENNPRRKLVEYWAEQFGVSYDEMMTADFEYIDYPFIRENVPHKGGGHLRKTDVRANYKVVEEEITAFVGEDMDINELRRGIHEIFNQHKI